MFAYKSFSSTEYELFSFPIAFETTKRSGHNQYHTHIALRLMMLLPRSYLPFDPVNLLFLLLLCSSRVISSPAHGTIWAENYDLAGMEWIMDQAQIPIWIDGICSPEQRAWITNSIIDSLQLLESLRLWDEGRLLPDFFAYIEMYIGVKSLDYTKSMLFPYAFLLSALIADRCHSHV